jgi:hypothetical protein
MSKIHKVDFVPQNAAAKLNSASKTQKFRKDKK